VRITLELFEAGAIDNSTFHHADHVRLAYELLGECEFEIAVARYAGALRRICASGGHPEKFHMTKTIGFLSVIAERRLRGGIPEWGEFSARHDDLFDRALLERWYNSADLETALAREVFVLPPHA
jgi:hypothetical protein